MRRETIAAGDDEEGAKYKARKQQLRVDDLKRFGIQTLLIDQYDDVPLILEAIEKRFRKKTVFVSGSAEEFGDWTRQEAQAFIPWQQAWSCRTPEWSTDSGGALEVLLSTAR